MAEGYDLSRTLEGGSGFLYENECVHCRKYSDSSVEAKVFCKTCRNYFCDICGRYHVRNLTSHQLIDVSNVKPTHSVQQKKYTIRSSCEVNVRVASDKFTSSIVDMCQLSDGTILLIDGSNNKLKIIVDTYNEGRFFLFKSAPLGVCSVSSSEVAVRLTDHTIQFISVNESLTVTRQVSINHPNQGFCGLACCSDKFWIPDNRGVYLYSLSDGSFFKKIEKDSQGRALFPDNRPQRIAVGNDGSMVYVTTWEDRVVVFNKNGDYIREIRDKRMAGTDGICITCDDIVLVSGFISRNVLVFDKNGVGLGELVSSKVVLGEYQSLCYDRLKSRLLVGNYKDTIQVIDLDLG